MSVAKATKLLSLILLAGLALSTARTAAAGPTSDQLVILSTTDMKGKPSPCGCHVPKGGFARQASFIDSMKASYDNVLVLDNGGFFPDQPKREDLARFMMQMMKSLGFSAAAVAERDLRFGATFLKDEAQRAGLPLVCANLVDKKTRKPFVTPYLVTPAGGLKVGVFGLFSPRGDLGPAGETLEVLDPAQSAREAIAALRKQGATVVVLLSQLGKVESEDLVATLEGVDAVVPGHNVPMIQKGRKIKDTMACYGGEQGQFMCKTMLTLNDQRQVANAEADAVMLGPAVVDHPQIQKAVRSFEDGYNNRMLKERNAAAAASATATPADSAATR